MWRAFPRQFGAHVPSATPSYIRLTLAADGRPIDILACGHLIQLLSDCRHVQPARQVHARLVLLGIVPDNFLGSKLLSFYSKAGHLFVARRVFDKIPQKTTFSFNAMLFAYSHCSRHVDAVQLFSLLVFSNPDIRPDGFTVTSLLKSLSLCPWLLLDARFGKEVHAFVVRHGFAADVFVSNALISFYARAGHLGLARKVFDQMVERDIVSWNSMICGYSQSGEWDRCLDVYMEMQKVSGLPPDRVTVVGVLQACSQLKDMRFGMEVHNYVIENGIEIDNSLRNSLIGFYGKCGNLDYARQLFDEMILKDEVSYNAMISSYMSHGFAEKGMELFRKMGNPNLSTWNAILSGLVQHNLHTDVPKLFIEMQSKGFKPNSVTLASVLPTLSNNSNLMGGKQIHCYALRTDCANNIYVATALIDMYGKCGFLEGAGRVFAGTTGRSVILWTAVVSAYAAHGEADAALAFFDEMLKSGTRPDPITFTAVLSACAHAGKVKEAELFFEIMSGNHGIEPTLEHYACVAATLSHAGMLHEAIKFVCRMPMKPNAKVWGSLLNGASILSNVEVGKYAFDRLVEIEPDCTGNYIIMANIYSRAEKWEEADEVRELMKGRGLSKLPGCSWIDTVHGLQSFVASDT